MDRASDYGSEGWEFKSLRARHLKIPPHCGGILFSTDHSTIGSITAVRRPFGKMFLNNTGKKSVAITAPMTRPTL